MNEGTGLTRNQFLIWLGQETAGDKPIFNELSLHIIPDELDVARFHRAFALMLSDFDACRTRVTKVDGRPRAEILAHVPFESDVLDLSTEEDVSAALDRWALMKVDSTIDLSVRPFDSTLIRLAPDRFAWGLLCHQLFFDAASMGLVYERVGDRYRQLAGSIAPARDDAMGFAEYVQEQVDDARSEKHRRREEYWTTKLADPPDPVTFYGGHCATAHTVVRLHRTDHALGPELTAAVRAFATAEGVRSLSGHLSTYSIFCAALVAYLHKLSGNGRIEIGCTWHNRPRTFGSTVGLFMEQDPFAVDVDPDDTFLTLIGKVQAEALGSMRHLPYAAGNPGGRAYDVSMNYLKAEVGPFAGVPIEHHWYRPSFGDGSLHVQVHDFVGRQDLTISFDFSDDVFTPDDRDAVVAHYVACLTAMIADPEQTVSSASILTDRETQLLEDWSGGAQDYPRDMTVVDLFEAQAHRRPDAVAVSCGDERLTYAQLRARARELSARMREAGVAPGVTVGLLLDRSVDLAVALLGVLGAGGAYVPLDPAFPTERLEYMLEDSGAQVLLTERLLASRIQAGACRVVCVDGAADAADRDVATPDGGDRPGAEDLAYIIYTSGSTGRPKGVEIAHRALTNLLCSMAEEPGCAEDDVVLAVTTLSFDIAGLELFLPLIVGGRVEIASRETAADGRLLRSQLDRGMFTILQATPATWRMLLDVGWTGTTGLKALIGGEALPGDLVQPLLDRTASLHNMYGPTEATIWSSTRLVASARDEITVGRPIANTGFHIVDDRLRAVPIGIAGELLISGDGLARGYHDRPELTAEKFVQLSPQGTRGPVRMYRTGDLARFRRDGELVHLGRLDDQVKIRGFRIELGEIEAVLSAHRSVQQAVVVARDAHTASARLIAYVVPKGSDAVDAVDLRRHLRESVPPYMVPAQFVAMTSLPLTLNGKVDRLRLPAVEPTQGARDGESASRSHIEDRVAEAFCDVLGLPSVSLDADFFDLGGQSILALRLVSHLGEELGVELPLQSLFDAPTVRALSRRVQTLMATTPALRAVILEGTDLEQRLREIWASVTGSEDRHGAPGGAGLTHDQVLALLAQVRQEFGVAAEGISALTFEADPTVDGLARVLRDALHPPEDPVVPLQPHGEKAPLFLVHAGGGYVFFYRALAARLGPEQPVHAIRAATRRDRQRKRFDQTTSIEDLAASYIEEIRRIQPEGPYNLGGSCFGGVVAFEMAHQLRAAGEALAAPILLFDAYVGKVGEDWEEYASRTLRSVAERLGGDSSTAPSGLPRLLLTSAVRHPRELLALIPLTARSLYRRAAGTLRGTQVRRWFDAARQARSLPDEQEQLDTMQRFLDTSVQLVSKYEPRKYPGPAVLLKASVGLDPEPMWTPLIDGGLQVHVRPGEHLDMMEEPWVEETAQLVQQALEMSTTQGSSAAGAIAP